MQGINVSDLNESIFNFFQYSVEEQSVLSKFVKRKSKLSALSFFKAIIAACLSGNIVTLEGICSLLNKQKVCITKQGIAQRMNEKAVSLFQQLFSLSLDFFTSESGVFSDIRSLFTHIYIIDSSTVSLPDSLKELYKGCGGSGSSAAIKLQVLYDYIEGQIKELTLTPGHKNDQGFDNYFTNIKANALYLMDLGYFKLPSFEKIISGDAFFISRYFMGTKLFDLEHNPIDLPDLLRNSGSLISQDVLIGAKTKLKVRLVAQQLPDDIVEQRIRRLKRDYKRRGHKLSTEKRVLSRWNIFITNVSEQQLDNSQIFSTYALRWQIELLFKLSKSGMKIHVSNSKKPARIFIELYAKLICLMLLLFFCSQAQIQSNKNISFLKACKCFFLRATDFINALISIHKLKRFTKKFIISLVHNAIKETKNKKLNPQLTEMAC